MRGINKVILLGSLGDDPQITVLPNGQSVARFSVATNEYWKDKDGEKKESTEWHRCTVYGKLADIAGEYLRKGSKAYLEGKNKTRKWQDENGVDRWTTEIQVNTIELLDSKQSATTEHDENEDIPF